MASTGLTIEVTAIERYKDLLVGFMFDPFWMFSSI